MQEIKLLIPVSTNAEISPDELAAVVQRLIEIGMADAEATLDRGEGDLDAAALVADLAIGDVTVAKPPRVLAFLSGGRLDAISDDEADVWTFDCDEYKASAYNDEEIIPVPARFADFAKLINAPCEADAGEEMASDNEEVRGGPR
jgi:hypothetical protein